MERKTRKGMTAMESCAIDGLRITPEVRGAREYRKVSYPIRYGRYCQIETSGHVYQFDRNGEIRHLRGKGGGWPHPAEWLKRTAGNDWVYYSSGEYREVLDLTGEYYLPCLSYPSNAVAGGDPFAHEAVRSALGSLPVLRARLEGLLRAGHLPAALGPRVARIARTDENASRRRAERLHGLLGGPLTVLPPDTRHVDYDVIPLVAADGCAYHCSFCCLHDSRPFRPRDRADVEQQIETLRAHYGREIGELNALFLGNHDALRAGADRIEFAARRAHERLRLGTAFRKGARLFLFGSADTLKGAGEDLFRRIDGLPFDTCINVGLESPDPQTLAWLGKPLTQEDVGDAFGRMLEINARYERVEVTVNFVLGDRLPPSHLPALIDFLAERPEKTPAKGAVYLSPLRREPDHRPDPGESKRFLRSFREVKFRSRLPSYLYLIQRL